jgi:hypothetical protein
MAADEPNPRTDRRAQLRRPFAENLSANMDGHTVFDTDLGEASAWCDSACERCPLLRQCRVGQAVTRRLTSLQREDGPEAVMAGVTSDLNRALVMLEGICAEEGIDLETLEPPPVRPLVARAEELGGDLVRAAVAVTEAAVRSGRVHEAVSSRLVGDCTLLAVKVVRVAWDLAEPEPLVRCEPIEPILLLVERTSAQVRRQARMLAPFVPPLVAGRFAAAHGAMIDFVSPWIAGVGAGARAELEARIAAGCAPSPFCRCGDERAPPA